jgi:hypothetical protein
VTLAQEDKLQPSDGASGDFFGWSVAADNDVVVVGSYFHDGLHTDEGAAYVYRQAIGAWSEEAKNTACDASPGAGFGASVAACGSRIAIGSPFHMSVIGLPEPAVYVFEQVGSSWGNERKITPSGPANASWFGESIAMDADRLAVGASHDDDAGTDAGAAYVFEGLSAATLQEYKLTQGVAAGDVAGNSVDLEGDRLVVGAVGNASLTGAAFVYRRINGGWYDEKVIPPIAAGQSLGRSVAVSGDQALFGANNDAELGQWAGAAYVYDIPEIVLSVDPEVVSAGDLLTFTTCGGDAGQLAVLFITAVNGSPLFQKVLNGSFNAAGLWTFSSIVSSDPNLPGNHVSFRTFALSNAGPIVQSNEVRVTFQ